MATRITRNMRQALRGLVDGGDFDAFVESTSSEWEAMAAGVRQRAGYASIEVDDLVQAMLIAVWEHVPRWEPARGDLARYVLFNAHKAAHRAALEAKGLHGRGRNQGIGAQGIYVLIKSTCWKEETDSENGWTQNSSFENMQIASQQAADEDDSPEVLVETKERADGYLRHATARDRVLVTEALRYGSIQLGAEQICADPALCRELRLRDDDLDWTRRVVRRAVLRTIERAEGEVTNGDETQENDEHETHQPIGGGSAPGQGERKRGPGGISPSEDRFGYYGFTADGTTARKRAGLGGGSDQLGALVQAC